MILALGDERLLVLVLADILLLPLMVPLGASAILLVGVPTLVLVVVLAVLFVHGAVFLLLGTLLLGTLGSEVTGLAAVEAGLRSCLSVVEGTLELVDDQCKLLVSQHLQLLICHRHKRRQAKASKRKVSVPELPTRAIDLEVEASA